MQFKVVKQTDITAIETMRESELRLELANWNEKYNELNERYEELTSKIAEYKKQIMNLVTKKAKISGESSASGSYLKQLYNQRTKLEEQLNSGAEYIKAPSSGIVSYKVDGL